MAKLHLLFLVVQIIKICVNAAPSDVSKLEEIATVKTADSKVDPPLTLADASKTGGNDETQGQRQKRFYNYYGFGFPPMNPVIYPNYAPPDPRFDSEDPLAQIYRRLQDIAGAVRTQNFNQPPPPPPIPFLFPVIYIPQAGCGCAPNRPRPQPPRRNGTVDLNTRFPEMDDVRQNWGIVVNQTEPDDGQEEDYTRPISFVPIGPNRPMSRPPPPVEHGSSQGGGSDPVTTTTVRPQGSVQNLSPPASAAVTPPSMCDAAVLSCCHQSQVTYDCFVLQGCPDPTAYGNPCDSQVILSVIDRFQKFYGVRSG